jgi:hypothetical protein
MLLFKQDVQSYSCDAMACTPALKTHTHTQPPSSQVLHLELAPELIKGYSSKGTLQYFTHHSAQ